MASFGPPGDYSTGPMTSAGVPGFGPPRNPVGIRARRAWPDDEPIWLTDTEIGSVYFDSDDRVYLVTYRACDRESEGALGYLLYASQLPARKARYVASRGSDSGSASAVGAKKTTTIHHISDAYSELASRLFFS
jgi:hypothetical protein